MFEEEILEPYHMKKCDFCVMSGPTGKCRWNLQCERKEECEKAIIRMISALQACPLKAVKTN